LAKYLPRKLWLFPVLVLISLLAGFLPDIGNRFGITRILAFFVFFAAGLFCTEKTVEGLRKAVNPLIGTGILLCAIAGSLVAFVFFNYSKQDMVMMQYSSLQMFTKGLKVTLDKRELQPRESTKLKIAMSDRSQLLKARQKPRVLMITNDPDHAKVVIKVNVK
jgi:hypothetical protein